MTVSFNKSGPVPLTASEIRARIVRRATALSPGLTDDLPGSLIEDIVSTAVGGGLVCDSARIEAINAVGASTANEFVLTGLAAQYGIPPRADEGLTSVEVYFTGPPGFSVQRGFIVSGGGHQYAITASVICGEDGETEQVTALATSSGVWAVVPNTVTGLVTSVPKDIDLKVNNRAYGIPAAEAETRYDFRDRVWEAGMSSIEGIPKTVRTALSKVNNVNPRLVSMPQVDGKFVIMCGGGDYYEMAGAVFNSIGDFTRLVLTTLQIDSLSTGETTTVKTNMAHGFSTGSKVQLNDVFGWDDINGKTYTATVLNPNMFTIDADSSGLSWTGTGYVTPNVRNHLITVSDWPDEYKIPLVVPMEQDVKVNFQWRTDGTSYLNNETILSLIDFPVRDYINNIYAGNVINLNTLKEIFLDSTSGSINRDRFTYLRVTVTVDGSITEPDTDTDVVSGDRFSYFFADTGSVSVREPV